MIDTNEDARVANKTRFALLHKRCGAIAYYLSKEPTPFSWIRKATSVNGNTMRPGVSVICPFCQGIADRNDTRLVHLEAL